MTLIEEGVIAIPARIETLPAEDERAFVDVFELMDQCRFRDCKHDREPGCAVRQAIEDGRLDPDRFANLERLIAEEAALEAEQEAREKAADRRRPPRLRRNLHPGTQRAPDDVD